MLVKKLATTAMAGAIVLSLTGGLALVAQAQSDAIAARKANRKEARDLMGAIKKIVDAKSNAADIVPLATKLADITKAFPALFPAGSDQGNTEALPTVWSDKAGFEAASDHPVEAANKLADTAKGGDWTAIGAAFGDTAKSCGACHQKYRKKS
jgi:cytochrome c556